METLLCSMYVCVDVKHVCLYEYVRVHFHDTRTSEAKVQVFWA